MQLITTKNACTYGVAFLLIGLFANSCVAQQVLPAPNTQARSYPSQTAPRQQGYAQPTYQQPNNQQPAYQQPYQQQPAYQQPAYPQQQTYPPQSRSQYTSQFTGLPNPQLRSPFPPAAQSTSAPVRVKDITTIEGHRSNRVTGFGLVTGLKGTGSTSPLTQRIGRNMLQDFDIFAENVPTGNSSVVVVSAEIPPFTRPGEIITASVSVFDDAEGLFGGVLQSTALKGFDNQVYAIAGGELNLSGFSVSGDAGSIAKNHDTAGKVNAQIELGIQEQPAFPAQSYRLLLTNKDYATAHRIAEQINQLFPGHAQARDQGSVDVVFPRQYWDNKFEFVVQVNELRVIPDIPARVVINQKTGTIVIGQNVTISRVVFANENLVVTTSETPEVSQPAPFSQGQTQVVPRTDITASESGGNYNPLGQQTTVGELAAVLNTLGVPPRDLIGVFQSIRASGALQAQLIIE